MFVTSSSCGRLFEKPSIYLWTDVGNRTVRYERIMWHGVSSQQVPEFDQNGEIIEHTVSVTNEAGVTTVITENRTGIYQCTVPSQQEQQSFTIQLIASTKAGESPPSTLIVTTSEQCQHDCQ